MFSKDDATPETRPRAKFWRALDESPFVMIGLTGVEDDRTRPMTAQVDVPEGGDKDDGGTIYFFASKSDGVGERVTGTARAVATFVGKDHGVAHRLLEAEVVPRRLGIPRRAAKARYANPAGRAFERIVARGADVF